MPSKSIILKALEQGALVGFEMPSIDIAPRLDNLIDQFETNLKSVAGELHRNGSKDLVQDKVDSLIAEGKKVLSMVEGVNGNFQVPEDPHDLKSVDFSVLQGELAVAENGAIWVKQAENGHRVSPYICENLLLLVDADKIVANMHEAMPKITLNKGGFGGFISGPSKTADIEQALVVGAHGACTLNVYLIN